MKKEDLFRIGCISADSSKDSLKGSIRRLIYSVLVKNNNIQLTVPEIIVKINNEYSLSFASDEISDALIKDYNIDCHEDGDESKYRLIPKKYAAISTILNEKALPVIIKKYLQSFENSYDIEKVTELITNYIYNVFNRNRIAIFNLINLTKDEELQEDICYSETEKMIINDFLSWDNKEKDIAIYSTVSYCVDYCMLTTKKDTNTFASVFSGKRFYLDANVVLRLIGFNNLDRKTILELFIKRCKEASITIHYSNFTIEEVENTIDYYVSKLANINKNNKPLSNIQYARYVPNKKDIINLYNLWRCNNQYNDYVHFAKYLKEQVENVLASCSKVTFPNQKLLNQEEYENHYNSLKNFKETLKIDTYPSSLDVDINNFLNVKNQRVKEHGNNLFNLNTYFITTDSKMCEWNKELYPGETQICILPSIWYSILLKTTGRTEDDYRAFTSFLNMRYKIDPEENTRTKEEILTFVQDLPEVSFMKEKILDAIYEKIKKPGFSFDAKKIVEETEVEVEQYEIEKYSEIIGKKFLSEGKMSIINKIVEEKIDRKYAVINFFNIQLPKIIPFLNWIFYSFLFIELLLIVFGIDNKSKIFISIKDSNNTLDILSTIRTVGGICTILVGMVNWILIKPLQFISSKFNKEKDIEKFQKKLIKKYVSDLKQKKVEVS